MAKEFTLHKGQPRLLNDKTKAEHAICAGVGWGKALALDTPIATATGFVSMGDLRVGDQVFDEMGQPCKVIDTSPIYVGHRCYDVRFDDGSSIIADAGHLWHTSTHKQRKNGNRHKPDSTHHNSLRRIPTSSIVTTEQIRETVRGPRGYNNHSIPMCGPVEWPKTRLPIAPYTLGVWLGDGHSAGSSLTTMDPEVVQAIKTDGYPVGPGVQRNSGKALQYCIGWMGGHRGDPKWRTQNLFVEYLRDLNLINNKHVPKRYLFASPEQRLELLRGLMDTDGYSDVRGICEFCSTIKQIADSVVHILHSLGIKLSRCDGPAKLYGRQTSWRYRVHFAADIPVFKIPRKLDRQMNRPKRRQGRTTLSQRYVVSVEPVPSVPVRCITVDSPSGLYLAGEAFIPTHNTRYGPIWSLKRCIDNHRSPEFLVIAPDNKLLKNRCLAEFESFLTTIGMVESKDFKINLSTGDMKIVFRWGLRPWSQSVFFLSGEVPSKITSYNAFGAWVDEPGLMVDEVFTRLYMRLRCPLAFYIQTLYTGTPEGITYFSERFSPPNVQPTDDSRFSESDTQLVLHGASHDNPYLSEDFLRTLEKEFGHDPSYYANYVLGRPASLSKDRFYFSFDERKNVGDWPPDPATTTLIPSFDNNVGQLTWAALQPFEDKYVVVADNGGKARNLQEACIQFIERFPPEIWGKHSMPVMGDAALHARSNQSYDTGFDVILDKLKPHYPRLFIQAARGNSFVEERNRCTNKALADGKLVVDRGALKVLESLKKVEMGPNGKPKKGPKDTKTHAMEAVDHALIELMPPQIMRSYSGLKG